MAVDSRIIRAVQRKIERSQEIICLFEADRNTHACISFGKDSMLMLWMILDAGFRPPVIWFDGGRFDEFPETRELAERACRDWEVELIRVTPRTSLLDQWRKHGVPMARGHAADREYGRQFGRAINGQAHRMESDGGYVGMRAAESPIRRRLLESRGPIYFHQGDGLWRCCPLWDWETWEIWHATDALGLPVHPVYSQDTLRPREELRLGVLAESCFSVAGALTQMRRYYPGLWNELTAEFPELRAHA